MREGLFLNCDGNSHLIVYDRVRGEPVCSLCGLVLEEDRFDLIMEGAAVSKITRHARGTRKARGTAVKAWSVTGMLQNSLEKAGAPKTVRDKAHWLYHSIHERGLERGYNAATIAKALVYTGYKLSEIPVALNECGAISRQERKHLAALYRRMCSRLNLKVPTFESLDYVQHLSSRLKISQDVLKLAEEILKKAKANGMENGRNPLGIACSAIYVAQRQSEGRLTQKMLAQASALSESTVRVNCSRIRELLPDPAFSRKRRA